MIDWRLSGQSLQVQTAPSDELLSNPDLISETRDQAIVNSEPGLGLENVVDLLDASLRRLLFGHRVSDQNGITEGDQSEGRNLLQLAPSTFCPGYCEVSPVVPHMTATK